MSISVAGVILNYNSFEDCKKCINFLKEQIDVNLHIIVVDNNSEKDVNRLKEFCEKNQCIFISNSENRGYSAGNNIGLKKGVEIGCKYGIIINPDIEIRERRYVKKAIDVLEKNSQIAVLGTDIINVLGQHQNPLREVRWVEEVFWPFEIIRNKIRKKTLPYIMKYKKSGFCEKVSGCCFFIRMDFVEKMGYFDEAVFLYCEEPILAKTVKKMGYKEFYLAELVAYHIHKKEEKGDPKKRLLEFYKSRSYYIKKYSGYKGVFLKIALLSRKIQNIIFLSKYK